MTAPAFATVARPDVKVNGSLLASTVLSELLDLRVQLPLNAPGQLTMRFFDETFELIDATTFQVGGEVKVDLPDLAGQMHAVFTGEIVSIGIEQGPNKLTELVVVAFDRSHRFGRASQGRTFLDQTYGDVVKKIAGEHGMQSKVQYLGTGSNPYLLQTGDDAAFLTETARRTGAQWKVEDNTLTVFKPPLASSSAATLEWQQTLLSFRARFSASDWSSDVSVRGWDPKSKKEIVGQSSTAPTFLGSSTLATGGRSKAKTIGSPKRTSRRHAVTSVAEANEIASAYMSQTASEEVLARGECYGNPAVKPGAMVTIKGMGARTSGDYYVTEVEHIIANRGYFTRFTAGSMEAPSMGDLVGGGAVAGGAMGGGGGGGAGVAIGLVSNLNDPDGLGRVKVKFPVFGENLESDWARVVSPAAGSARGFMMMPSVNDEVLVVFEQGDPRRPFIIGGVWNGLDKPPYPTADWLKDGKVVRWGFTTPTGHKLAFNDSDDAKAHLEIMLSDGQTKLVLGKDKVELIANSKNLEVKSGQASVLLSEGKDVVIKGQKVTIEAATELQLSGKSSVNVKGTSVKVAADASLEMAGNAKTAVGGGGMTEVKGSMVKIN